MEFSYDSSNPTHGIFWYLYNNQNIPYANAVFASSSSNHNENALPHNAIDYYNNKYWLAEGNRPAGEYIAITTFYVIKLKGYVIQTSDFGADACHPRYWSFATSSDGVKFNKNVSYKDTDGRMNNNLRHTYVPFTSDKVKYFRIYVTGLSYCNGYAFDLNQVELFGTLYNVSDCFSDETCNRYHYKHFSSLILLMIFFL